MSFTRASFHFRAADGQPVATFYRHTDGYLSGAAEYLRALLLDWGAFSVEAFALGVKGDRYGSSQATDPNGDPHTSFRYTFEGENVRGEQRLMKGQEQWQQVYIGSVLDLVNAHGSMLHRLGPDSLRLGGADYATLKTLETRYAQAESRRMRHDAGIVSLGGHLAAGQADELRNQVLSALRAEAGNYEPALKTYTVIAEIWDNEQGYCSTVSAVDADEAIEKVQAEYRTAAYKARGAEAADESEEDEDDGDGPLRIWAVVEGAPDVVYTRDAE